MLSPFILQTLRSRSDEMVRDVAELVSSESPSDDLAAVRRCADVVAKLGSGATGAAPQWQDTGDRSHLVWRFGDECRVLLVGHCDTVWPLGTIDRWPFTVAGDRASGPGVFDMKAGIVQMFAALSVLDDQSGIAIVISTDEEIGSPTSRTLIESLAREADSALVLEASAAGAVKTARKGASTYELTITGKTAHAGLEPDSGINATTEAAHQVLAIAALHSPHTNTSVVPSALVSGTTTNTVPGQARLSIDSRATSRAEQERIDAALRSLTPVLPGARLELSGGIDRAPLEDTSSMGLFARANSEARRLGLPPLTHAAVGGASDGNLTAGVGTPTLDGLGAVGEHAHAEGEWASVIAMAERAALLAALIDSLQARPTA